MGARLETLEGTPVLDIKVARSSLREGGKARERGASAHADPAEEAVVEGSARFGAPPQGGNGSLPPFRRHHAAAQHGIFHTLHHGSEGGQREAGDQLWTACIRIDEQRVNAYPAKPRLNKQRVELTADQRVAARPSLQLDEAGDGGAGILAIWVKVRRSVISLDHGDGTPRDDRDQQTF